MKNLKDIPGSAVALVVEKLKPYGAVAGVYFVHVSSSQKCFHMICLNLSIVTATRTA